MTNPTEAPTAGKMAKWLLAATPRPATFYILYQKAQEVDAEIASLKDALAAAEARACGLAEALEAIPCFGCGQVRGHASADKRICGCSISTIQCRRCAALTDARCSHKERVETLERELAFAKAEIVDEASRMEEQG